ncbi:unnamed protein product [Linum tenue]|uniref:DELLA protein RGL1 n=1 Tax=Linum tenue TaxID=586396 RepID=A0AAV0IQU1_9ROSI|nr:unnamed protein product [Linum tenue]
MNGSNLDDLQWLQESETRGHDDDPASTAPAAGQRLSFDLLQKFGQSSSAAAGLGSPDHEEIANHDGERLPAEEVVRIAAARIVKFSSHKAGAPSMLQIPFDPALSHLSDEDLRDVELAECLLAAAERVGDKQFNHASALLNLCDSLASKTGNPLQRLGYCLCQALRDRIAREKTMVAGGGGEQPPSPRRFPDLEESLITKSEFAITAMTRGQIPMYQVPHLVAVQAILERVASARQIHVIDLRISNGQQWVALMQGLVSRWSDRTGPPVHLLRVSAVVVSSSVNGTTVADHLASIEETGDRLTKFAESMDVPFRFEIVVMEDGWGFSHDRFGLNLREEALVVYSEYGLRGLMGQPRQAEHVMRVLKQMRPRAMVTIEVEANLNSPNFAHRFVEAMFHYSGVFENIELGMTRDDPNRVVVETVFVGDKISNILACEGEERYMRSVRIGVWRKFFAQFGMVEVEPSEAALHQANLFIEKFSSGHPYTISMDGQSMVLGFKTTPMVCVSTWKFVHLAKLVSNSRDELRVEFY